ncbi:MFS transporter [Nocardia crassostreae]|uniref:MFS transporter n=1 Tax=Nocardia crassostreae TaxID=53428 RepID=UPI0008365AB7|nr:MFS transporter [Nocardia crassostreae]
MTRANSLGGLEGIELSDYYGRRYRIGGSERDHSRRGIFWLCCALMLAAGMPQYGYAVLVAELARANRWSPAAALSVLAAFVVVQAGIAFPTAFLRDRGWLSARAAVLLGGLLCAAGLLAAAHTGNLRTVALGYGVCAGLGVGLIYATVLATVVRWHPERGPDRIGIVTGAFACGGVPLAVVSLIGGPPGVAVLFEALAVAVLLIVAGTGWWLRLPPARWWPARVDPRAWALDRRINPGLRGNRQPLRVFRPGEAVRTPAFGRIFALLICAAAVFLGDLAYLAAAALGDGFSTRVIALAFALLIGVNGAARAVAATLSDRLGRRRLLTGVLIVSGTAQWGLIGGVEQGSSALLLVGAVVAALGAGCCFPLCAALVQDWFGAESSAQNIGIMYSAKAFGSVVGVGAVAVSGGDPRIVLLFVAMALTGALIAARLRQPGLPVLGLPGTA